jgi:hypothetical protein
MIESDTTIAQILSELRSEVCRLQHRGGFAPFSGLPRLAPKSHEGERQEPFTTKKNRSFCSLYCENQYFCSAPDQMMVKCDEKMMFSFYGFLLQT